MDGQFALVSSDVDSLEPTWQDWSNFYPRSCAGSGASSVHETTIVRFNGVRKASG